MVGATAWGSTPFLFRQQGKVLSGYGLLGSLIDLGLDGIYGINDFTDARSVRYVWEGMACKSLYPLSEETTVSLIFPVLYLVNEIILAVNIVPFHNIHFLHMIFLFVVLRTTYSSCKLRRGLEALLPAAT